MPALFVLAMLAAADAPITVKGHQWAPFISPMGEPFRAHSTDDDTLAKWFYQADRNRDGVLTIDEMIADADRFFATLDTDHDGEIGPDEIANYEYEIAPDIQVMSRTQRAPGQPAPAAKGEDDHRHDRERMKRRTQEEEASLGIGGALQGAARYGLLNLPEPVAAADTDFNRAITLEEFRAAAIARFQLLDSAHQGRVSLAQLEALRPDPWTKRKRDDKADDARIGSPLPTSGQDRYR
jgi:Ca2+-binding EF-hand superfamily protein